MKKLFFCLIIFTSYSTFASASEERDPRFNYDTIATCYSFNGEKVLELTEIRNKPSREHILTYMTLLISPRDNNGKLLSGVDSNPLIFREIAFGYADRSESLMTNEIQFKNESGLKAALSFEDRKLKIFGPNKSYWKKYFENLNCSH